MRVGRMQQQSDVPLFPCPPALSGALPADIPDAHSLEPEAANVLSIECALGAPVEDQIGVQEHAGGREVMVAPPRLAGGYSRAAQALPFPIRSRQHNTQLLDIRVAVDDYQQLSPVDRLRVRRQRQPWPGRSKLARLRN